MSVAIEEYTKIGVVYADLITTKSSSVLRDYFDTMDILIFFNCNQEFKWSGNWYVKRLDDITFYTREEKLEMVKIGDLTQDDKNIRIYYIPLLDFYVYHLPKLPIQDELVTTKEDLVNKQGIKLLMTAFKDSYNKASVICGNLGLSVNPLFETRYKGYSNDKMAINDILADFSLSKESHMYKFAGKMMNFDELTRLLFAYNKASRKKFMEGVNILNEHGHYIQEPDSIVQDDLHNTFIDFKTRVNKNTIHHSHAALTYGQGPLMHPTMHVNEGPCKTGQIKFPYRCGKAKVNKIPGWDRRILFSSTTERTVLCTRYFTRLFSTVDNFIPLDSLSMVCGEFILLSHNQYEKRWNFIDDNYQQLLLDAAFSCYNYEQMKSDSKVKVNVTSNYRLQKIKHLKSQVTLDFSPSVLPPFEELKEQEDLFHNGHNRFRPVQPTSLPGLMQCWYNLVYRKRNNASRVAVQIVQRLETASTNEYNALLVFMMGGLPLPGNPKNFFRFQEESLSLKTDHDAFYSKIFQRLFEFDVYIPFMRNYVWNPKKKVYMSLHSCIVKAGTEDKNTNFYNVLLTMSGHDKGAQILHCPNVEIWYFILGTDVGSIEYKSNNIVNTKAYTSNSNNSNVQNVMQTVVSFFSQNSNTTDQKHENAKSKNPTIEHIKTTCISKQFKQYKSWLKKWGRFENKDDIRFKLPEDERGVNMERQEMQRYLTVQKRNELKLENLKTSYEAKIVFINKLEQKLKTYQTVNQQQAEEIKKLEEIRDGLIAELKMERKEVEKLTYRSQQTQKQLEETNNALVVEREKNYDLNSRLNVEVKNREELALQRTQLENEIDQIRDVYNQLLNSLKEEFKLEDYKTNVNEEIVSELKIKFLELEVDFAEKEEVNRQELDEKIKDLEDAVGIIDLIQNNINHLDSTIKDLKAKLEANQKLYEKLEKNEGKLETEKEIMIHINREMKEEIKEEKKKLVELEQKIQNVQNRHEVEKQELQLKYETEKKELNVKYDNEKASMKQNHDAEKKEMEQKTNEEKQQEIITMQQRHDKEKEEMQKNHDDAMKEFQSKYENQTKQLELENKKFKELENERNELKQELFLSSKSVVRYQQEIGQNKTSFVKMETEYKSAFGKLANLNRRYSVEELRLKNRIKELEKKMDTYVKLKANETRLAKEKEALEQKLESTENNRQFLLGHIEKMKINYQQLSKQKDEEASEFEKEIEDLMKEDEKRTQEIQELYEIRNKLKSELDTNVNKYNDLNAFWKDQKEISYEEKNRLKKTINDLSNKLYSLSQLDTNQKEKIGLLQKEVENLVEKEQKLEMKINHQDARISSYIKENQKSRDRVTALHTEKGDLEFKFKTHEREFKEMQIKMEEKLQGIESEKLNTEKEYENNVFVLKVKFEEMKKQCQKLTASLKEKEDENKTLLKEIKDNEDEIGNLRIQLSETKIEVKSDQTPKIEEQFRKLVKKVTEIYKLQVPVHEAGKLSENVHEKLNSIYNSVVDYEQKFSDLNKINDKQSQDLNEMDIVLDEKEYIIQQMEKELDEKAHAVQNIESTLNKNEKALKKYTDMLAEYQAANTAFHLELKKVNEKLKESKDSKDPQITKLINDIANQLPKNNPDMKDFLRGGEDNKRKLEYINGYLKIDLVLQQSYIENEKKYLFQAGLALHTERERLENAKKKLSDLESKSIHLAKIKSNLINSLIYFGFDYSDIKHLETKDLSEKLYKNVVQNYKSQSDGKMSVEVKSKNDETNIKLNKKVAKLSEKVEKMGTESIDLHLEINKLIYQAKANRILWSLEGNRYLLVNDKEFRNIMLVRQQNASAMINK